MEITYKQFIRDAVNESDATKSNLIRLGGCSEKEDDQDDSDNEKLLQLMTPWPYPPPMAHLPSLKPFKNCAPENKKKKNIKDGSEKRKRFLVMIIPHSKPILANVFPHHFLNYVKKDMIDLTSMPSASKNPHFISRFIFLQRSSMPSLPFSSLVPPVHLASVIRPNNNDIIPTKFHEVGISSLDIHRNSVKSGNSPFFPEMMKVCDW
jgi:hypothetical protein